MGGGDVGANVCVIGGDLLGVPGPQKTKIAVHWGRERLRNGSETAKGTAKFRPSPRKTLLLDVINDRGESHFHRTRHRGGRAMPVPGLPRGPFHQPGSFRGLSASISAEGSLNRKLPNTSKRLSDLQILRGRPGRRFLGEMTTPRRPGNPYSRTAVLSRDFQSQFYFTGNHSPTIKIVLILSCAAFSPGIFPTVAGQQNLNIETILIVGLC
jgi:hypothetical protein